MKRTAVEWLVEALRERGVEWMAALCGHGLDPLFDAATRAGMRLIDTRNEQTAAYIAEGYGRLTGRPGVCATSSGVAVANALTGVMNAWFDQAPMLYISGSADLPTLGLGCFQDLDQAGVVKPVSKYSHLVDTPERIVQMFDEAWQTACAPPRGPVHLMIPMDVQRAEVDGEALVRGNTVPTAPGVSVEAVDAAVRELRAARRPLIIAGSELHYSGEGGDLLAFAESAGIPVQTPIWDRGICPRESEAFVGVIGAASGDPGLPADSDCIVLAGAAADYRVGYLQTGVKVIRLDRGWKQLREKQDWPRASEWLAEARRRRTEFAARIRTGAEAQRVEGRAHAVDVIDALEKALPDEGTLLIDGGSIGQWAHQLLCQRRYPGYWLPCGRSGVVGFGIGGAMAARLADPRRPVLLLSGDGAFTFNVADLECAARQGLSFVAVVADDQCWGITHSGHLRQYGQGMATQLGAIPFDQLARSLGANGVRVNKREEIAGALDSALGSGGVTVIHVPIVGGNPGAD